MMKMIPRLEELRTQVAQIECDLAKLEERKATLDEALTEAQEAVDKNLLGRFRDGQPIRLEDIEAKTRRLRDDVEVVEATMDALRRHRAVLGPELIELEQAQKKAEKWHLYAVSYVAARALSGQVTDRIKRAFADAPARRIKMSSGGFRIEKSVPACVGAASMWEVTRLEYEALRALRTLDSDRFPRPENIDLTVTAIPLSANPPSTVHDRPSFNAVWEEFLAVRDQFLREHGIDLGPSDSEIETKLASPR